MRSTALKYLISFLLCLCLFLCEVAEVEGDYKLEVQLEQYDNPSHSQANGRCCSRPYYSLRCTECNNRFTFCILPFDTELSGSICGSSPSYSTGLVGSLTGHADRLSFVGESYIDEQNSITNPLVFTGNGSWPGKFQLVIKIKNWRSVFQEYLVDLIVENWLLPINTNQSRTLTGLKDISTLTVSAQATCTNGLLCDNCTKICDSTQGGEDEVSSPAFNPFEEASEKLTEPAVFAKKSIESKNQLTIGLSVAGSLIVLILLLLIIIVIVCGVMKRRNRRSRTGERQPFLHLPGPNNEQAAATAQDESFVSHQTIPNVYQRLPTEDSGSYDPTPNENRVLHYPDLARTGQLGRGRNGREFSSEYSVITHQNLDLSPAHSLDDIPEASDEEEVGGAGVQAIESGYNIIRQEDMEGYVSEDASEVLDEEEEGRGEEEVETGKRTEESVAAEIDSEVYSRPRMPTPPSN